MRQLRQIRGSATAEIIEATVRDGEPDRNIVCNEVYLSNIIITDALEAFYNQIYLYTNSPYMIQQ